MAAGRREVLHEVNLEIEKGEVTVLLGPNGAGKSSLARALSGDERVKIRQGTIYYKGQDLAKMRPEERARLGVMLLFQHPVAIPGVTLTELMRAALEKRLGRDVDMMEVQQRIIRAAKKLKLSYAVAEQEVNVNFSGGEKKKLELLQMLVLEPELVILDEIDSGLDVEAAKNASAVLAEFQQETGAGLLVITHNMRILTALEVQKVAILLDGRLVEEGGKVMMAEVEKNGFQKWREG